MRNCAIDGCPACHGRLDTKSPTYEEASENDKSIWYTCRRTAYAAEFDASEEAYKARTVEDLQEELGENKNEEARLITIIEASGYVAGKLDYKELFKDDVQTALNVVKYMLDRGKLMTTQQDLNRHIDWKINGIPENSYRDDRGRINPYKED